MTLQASLGITQHLIKSGIARLEEVRGADGTLENAYVRVDRAKVLEEKISAVYPGRAVHLIGRAFACSALGVLM